MEDTRAYLSEILRSAIQAALTALTEGSASAGDLLLRLITEFKWLELHPTTSDLEKIKADIIDLQNFRNIMIARGEVKTVTMGGPRARVHG